MKWKEQDKKCNIIISILHLLVAVIILSYTAYCYTILGRFEMIGYIFVLWGLAEGLLVVLIIIVYRKPSNHLRSLIKVIKISEKLAYMILIIGIMLYLHIFYTISESKGAFVKNKCENQSVLVLGSQLEDGEMDKKLIARLDYLISIRDIFDENETEYIVSGGMGRTEHSNVSEAELMREYLIQHGFPKNKIIMESSALSTYDNIVLTRDIWSDSELIVISSDYHLPRVKILLDDLGCENYRLLGAMTDSSIMPYYMFQEMIGIVVGKLGVY